MLFSTSLKERSLTATSVGLPFLPSLHLLPLGCYLPPHTQSSQGDAYSGLSPMLMITFVSQNVPLEPRLLLSTKSLSHLLRLQLLRLQTSITSLRSAYYPPTMAPPSSLIAKAATGLLMAASLRPMNEQNSTLSGLTHHPPQQSNANNLSFAVNGTGHVGIYNSSFTPDESYGTYVSTSEED